MGGSTNVTNKTTQAGSSQTDLPAWAKPYFQRNLAKAEAEYGKPYEAYTGERFAATGADTLAARDMTRDIAGQGISGLTDAQNYATYATDKAKELGNYTPTQASEFAFDPTRQFTGAEVQQYMNPYMQNVVDQQKQQAFTDFSRMNANRAQQGVNAGAFGGSRQGVVQGMAEEGLVGQLGQIQATGLKDAYGQATSAFQADRSAQTADQTAKAAEAARVQQMTEAGNQFAANQGIAALGAGAAAVQGGVDAGVLERQTDIQNAQLLEQVGGATTAEEQRNLDLEYQNYLEAQGYTAQQIGNMTGILSGQPIAATGTTTSQGTTTQTQPGPSFGQQLAGAGLTGISLYNAYGA
jgi:hypothetical protein